MRKSMRRIMSCVMAAGLLAGALFSGNGGFSAASGAYAATESAGEEDGLRLIGASVRFINDDTAIDGMRFAVGIRSDAYGTLSDEAKKSYHILIMPTALLGEDGELSKDESYEYREGQETKHADAADLMIDWEGAADEVIDGTPYKVQRIYLNKIAADYYTTGVTARAYFLTGDSPRYCDPIERSYYSVADAALEDVKEAADDEYANAVGSKFSPYDEKQRDALLGVKYEKTGTWDYRDGNLVTEGPTPTGVGTLIIPFLLDRLEVATSDNYIIETTFKVGYDDGTSPSGNDSGIRGLTFAYDSSDGSHYVLDVRHRDRGNGLIGYFPHLRYWDGKQWDPSVPEDVVPLEEGMWDFRITVDALTEGETEVYVEGRKHGERSYMTLIPSTKNPNNGFKKGRVIGPGKIGFTSEANGRIAFSPKLKVYDGAAQTRGKESIKAADLTITDKPTVIEGTFTYDYRTFTDGTQTQCTDRRREGLLFGTDSTHGYFLSICGHQGANAYHISLKKDTNGRWGNVQDKPFDSLSSLDLTKDKNLADNDEITVSYKITVTKNEAGHNVFDIDYTLSVDGDVFYTINDWRCEDKNGEQPVIKGLYLYSEDDGSTVKDEAVDGHICGDGKTIYFSTKVDGKNVLK